MTKKIFLFFILTCTTVCRAMDTICFPHKNILCHAKVEEIKKGYYKIKSINHPHTKVYKLYSNLVFFFPKKGFFNTLFSKNTKKHEILLNPTSEVFPGADTKNGKKSYFTQIMRWVEGGFCELTENTHGNIFLGLDNWLDKPITKTAAGLAGFTYPAELELVIKRKQNNYGVAFLGKIYSQRNWERVQQEMKANKNEFNKYIQEKNKWVAIFNSASYTKIVISLILVGIVIVFSVYVCKYFYDIFTAPDMISERSYPTAGWAWLKTCRPLSWWWREKEKPSRLNEIIISPALEKRINRLIEGYKVAAKKGTGMFNTILYGPTGTGKTMIANAIAITLNKEGIEYIRVDGADPSKLDKTQISDTWQRVFDEATRKGPCIILIDEVEALIGNHLDRDPANRSESLNTSKLLALLQNTFHKSYTLIVTTNLDLRNKEDLKKIDEAFLNRFVKSRRIRVGGPNPHQRMQLFDQYLKKHGKEAGLKVSVGSKYITDLEPYLKKLSTPRQIAGWTKEVIDEIAILGYNEIATRDVQEIINKQEYLKEEEKRGRAKERIENEEEEAEYADWYIEKEAFLS